MRLEFSKRISLCNLEFILPSIMTNEIEESLTQKAWLDFDEVPDKARELVLDNDQPLRELVLDNDQPLKELVSDNDQPFISDYLNLVLSLSYHRGYPSFVQKLCQLLVL